MAAITALLMVSLLLAAPISTTQGEERVSSDLSQSSEVDQQRVKRQTDTLRVTTILEPPFMMLVDEDGSTTDNNNYEGFIKDLLDEVSRLVGVGYRLQQVADFRYGAPTDDGTGSWTGMVGELIRREADVAASPLTVTARRDTVVDFIKPFMSSGIVALTKTPKISFNDAEHQQELEKSDAGQFLRYLFLPLEYPVWIVIVIVFILVWLVLVLVNVLNPYEWRKAARHGDVDLKEQNNLNFRGSCWYLWSTTFYQGILTPRSLTSRVVIVFWWVFFIVTILTYEASLVKLLNTNPAEDLRFNLTETENMAIKFDDLAKNDDVRIGALLGGSTYRFFVDSDDEVNRKIFRKMVGVTNTREGIDRVKNSDGNFVMLGEKPMLEYVSYRDCEHLRVLGPQRNARGYAFAVPLNSRYRTQMDYAMLQLLEDGTVQKLKNKYWKPDEFKECPPLLETLLGDVKKLEQLRGDGNKHGWGFQGVSIEQYSLAPLVMLIGLILTLITFILEVVCYRKRSQREVVNATTTEDGVKTN